MISQVTLKSHEIEISGGKIRLTLMKKETKCLIDFPSSFGTGIFRESLMTHYFDFFRLERRGSTGARTESLSVQGVL